MRKITPMPGACIEVQEDGTVQVRNWHIEGETDADDVTANGRVLAIIDWVRARAIAGANYSGDRGSASSRPACIGDGDHVRGVPGDKADRWPG